MAEPMHVTKYAKTLLVSDEQLANAAAEAERFQAWLNATPQQRAERRQQAEQARAAERSAAEPAPLTLEALLDKQGWTREYAEHLVQPYCDCYDSRDGWEYCQHARDLGLVP